MSRLSRILFLSLLLSACASPAATPSSTFSPTPPPTHTPTRTPTLTPTRTPTPAPTHTPTLTPSDTPIPTPTPPHTFTPPTDLWLGPDDLRVHPDGERFYSGDLLSFQVYAHHGYEWASSRPPDVDLEIWLGPPSEGELIAESRVNFYGNREGQARLEWVWDTSGLVGPQTLTVALDPDDEIQTGDEDPHNNLVTRTLELLPRAALPARWADAHWVRTSSACCVFYHVSDSAAERDLAELMALADRAVAFAGEQLGEELGDDKLDIYWVNRVLGHGGFAAENVILSYLDRFYAGGNWEQVLRHESVHVLDRRFASVRPSLLTEGLAVYVAGGHFRPEPLQARAAALLALERYIPLAELADDFYPSQHEIGYLEAGAFVGYLIQRFGWETYKAFYGGLQEKEAGQAAMIDAALQAHLGLSLDQAEKEWLATLRAISPPPAQITDLRLTIDFYETVRRYQQDWDPSAYFRQVWLPSLEEAEQKQITADFVRHPAGPVNVTLETMFVAADRAIDEGAYARAETLLQAINATLETGGDLQATSLTAEYYALVQATSAAGYEAQQIDLQEGSARVLTRRTDGPELVELTFSKVAGDWQLVPSGN